MKLNFKQLIGILMLGLTVVLGAGAVVNAQDQYNAQDRYRIRRGRSTYHTDGRGAELLRQAVNEGYRQGFQAGQADRNRRRRSSWNNNRTYRSADVGYQRYVSRGQYQYYFQQGFQKGYYDGYNSRNRYGSNNSILGTILDQIFKVERY